MQASANLFFNSDVGEVDAEILQALVLEGKISECKLDIAAKEVLKNKVDFLFFLFRSGILKVSDFEEVAIKHFGISCANFDIKTNFSEETFSKISLAMCLRERFFPITESEDELWVASRMAFEEGEDFRIAEMLGTSKKVVLFFALTKEINKKARVFFNEDRFLNFANNIKDLGAARAVKGDIISVKDPIIEFVELMFEEAVLLEVSEISLELKGVFFGVSFKQDGEWEEKISLHKEIGARIINRIKLISGLNLNDEGGIKAGKLEIMVFGEQIELTFTSFQVINGESFFIQIFYKEKEILSLEKLGISKNNYARLLKAAEEQSGIVFAMGQEEDVFYSVLNQVAVNGKDMLLLSQNRSYELPFARQVKVSGELEENIFALSKTSEVLGVLSDGSRGHVAAALKAASVGKKVFFGSSNAKDAISALNLLRNQDQAHSNVCAIMAYKMMRKLCSCCKNEVIIGLNELSALRLAKTDVKKIYESKGCLECRNTGYKGLMMISEVLLLDEEIDDLLVENFSRRNILESAKKKGFTTMFEDARIKVLQGITDIAEFKKVAL